MSTAALLSRPTPPAAAPDFYRFTVAQYQQMVQVGILGPDDPVELLEGWIVNKMARNPPHDGTLNVINALLARVLPSEWALRNQSVILLARSAPEPDLAIVRGPEEIYLIRHPRPADAALLIEVADTSRLKDRQQKGLWYAEAKIPEVWLVNLVEGQVEVYSQPRAGRSPAYRKRRDYRAEEQVPLVLDGQTIARFSAAQLCPVRA